MWLCPNCGAAGTPTRPCPQCGARLATKHVAPCLEVNRKLLTEPWEDAWQRLVAYFDPANPLGHYRDFQHAIDLATLRSTIEEQDAVIAGLDNALARMTAEADELEAERDRSQR